MNDGLNGKGQAGFLAVPAVIAMVALGAFAAGGQALASRAAETGALSLSSARAELASRSGLEMARVRALSGSCVAAEARPVPGFPDFRVETTCSRAASVEGGTPVEVFALSARACSGGACPAADPPPGHAERTASGRFWR